MKTLVLSLLTAVLFGCASAGHRMDPGRLAAIKPGETTKEEMLQWFGAPLSQTMSTDGKIAFMWMYTQAVSYGFHTDVKNQNLTASFGTNGIVEHFSIVDGLNPK